jgi:phage/plasmid primase-like uncharacterized protein
MMAQSELEQMAAVPRQAATFAAARAAADAFKGKLLENRDSGLVAVVSRNTLDKMLSESAVKKSTSVEEHTQAVANLDHLFQNATYGWEKEDRAGDRNIQKIHRLFAPMNTASSMRIVKLTVKEHSHDNQQNKLYTVEAMKVESSTSIWVNANLKHEPKSKSTPYAELEKSLADTGQQGNQKNESSASIWVAANLTHDGLESISTPYAKQVGSLANAVQKYNDAHARTREAPREYLVVPFAEKDAASKAGAWWDNKVRAWYVGPNANREHLKAWLPGNRQHRYASPEAEFREAMRSLGLEVSDDHPVADGKPHRVRADGDKGAEKAGYYTYHPDGRVPAGFIKNFRTGEEMRWRSQGVLQLNAEEQARLSAELATKKAERERERLAAQNEVAERARAKAGELLPVESPTPYLAAKGIEAHAGILTDRAGKTYVPAYDVEGKQWTMQTITEDGQKRFEKGGRKEGCFHVVGGQEALESADVILISEGYATAASVSEATGRPVVAAFDAGNLQAAALALRGKYPDKPIVICGDDDRHQEKNPGRAKAEAAALAVGGKAVFPAFPQEEAKVNPRAFTDFNDLARSLGKAEISRQVLFVIEQTRGEQQMQNLEAAKSWTREEAEKQAEHDVEHDAGDIAKIRDFAGVNPHYRAVVEELSPSLLRDIPLQQRTRSEADVLESPEDTRSEQLYIDDLDGRGREYNFQPGRAELEELRAMTPGSSPEDSRSEILEAIQRTKREREQREYMAGLSDGIDLEGRTGRELGQNEFIIPRSIAQKYVEVDGRYYTKDTKSPRIMFEDRGDKLRTSTTDRGAIEDMVKLAKAKQWTTLKLTGSKEFRREAWLQAESQGIKTRGYTPKEVDLAAMETLRQERATNSIQPVSERQAERAAGAQEAAPRHDMNKNQALMHVAATERQAENVEALKRNPALAGRSAQALEKLAYYRGILQEDVKRASPEAQQAALAKFDRAAENPAFVERLEKSDQAEATKERTAPEQRQERKDTYEQSL